MKYNLHQNNSDQIDNLENFTIELYYNYEGFNEFLRDVVLKIKSVYLYKLNRHGPHFAVYFKYYISRFLKMPHTYRHSLIDVLRINKLKKS